MYATKYVLDRVSFLQRDWPESDGKPLNGGNQCIGVFARWWRTRLRRGKPRLYTDSTDQFYLLETQRDSSIVLLSSTQLSGGSSNYICVQAVCRGVR